MKIEEFRYRKKDSDAVNDYSLLILNENSSHIAGIALNKLTEDEKAVLLSVQENYELKKKPFMKAYRSFIRDNIVGYGKDEEKKEPEEVPEKNLSDEELDTLFD